MPNPYFTCGHSSIRDAGEGLFALTSLPMGHVIISEQPAITLQGHSDADFDNALNALDGESKALLDNFNIGTVAAATGLGLIKQASNPGPEAPPPAPRSKQIARKHHGVSHEHHISAASTPATTAASTSAKRPKQTARKILPIDRDTPAEFSLDSANAKRPLQTARKTHHIDPDTLAESSTDPTSFKPHVKSAPGASSLATTAASTSAKRPLQTARKMHRSDTDTPAEFSLDFANAKRPLQTARKTHPSDPDTLAESFTTPSNAKRSLQTARKTHPIDPIDPDTFAESSMDLRSLHNLTTSTTQTFPIRSALPSYSYHQGVHTFNPSSGQRRIRTVQKAHADRAAIFRTHSFLIPRSRDTDADTQVLYEHISVVNHSCFPNTVVHREGGTAHLIAVSHIEPGDELTIDYNAVTDWPDTHTRRAALYVTYKFICTCEICVDPAYPHEVSGTVRRARLQAFLKDTRPKMIASLSHFKVESLRWYVQQVELELGGLRLTPGVELPSGLDARLADAYDWLAEALANDARNGEAGVYEKKAKLVRALLKGEGWGFQM